MSSQVEAPWPKILTVQSMDSFRLRVEMDSGIELELDLSELIYSREAYWRLRQKRYFDMVQIDEAGALCWPEGEDIAPESTEKYTIR